MQVLTDLGRILKSKSFYWRFQKELERREDRADVPNCSEHMLDLLEMIFSLTAVNPLFTQKLSAKWLVPDINGIALHSRINGEHV